MLNLTALELGQKIQNKEIAVRDAVLASLAQIEKLEPQLHAFTQLQDRETLLRRADEVQAGIDAGELTWVLAGVPMGIKDNICTTDLLTTCASKILENFVSPYNATVVEKLNAAGAVVMGKLNMDEFAMGSTTETSCYGITRNPWDENKVPGGSSGGSAAAVAAHMLYYALGSDTGGSIRQPSSYCGVTGVKPTYGSVSRYGLIAYGSSLDQIGPLARTAEDAAAVLQLLCGYDAKDSTSLPDFTLDTEMSTDMAGKRIGIPANYLGEGCDAAVSAAIKEAGATYEKMGAVVEYFDMPMMEYAVPAYYIIASAEASSNLSRFDGIKYGYHPQNVRDLEDLYLTARSEGFGQEVQKRIMLGAFVLSSGYYDAYYQKALKVKALIVQSFNKLYEKYDLILMPVAPTTAPVVGSSLADPLKMYLADIYTVSINLVGMPGVALPCGADAEGMPIGMQLVGRAYSDGALLAAARAYQQATAFHTKVAGGVL